MNLRLERVILGSLMLGVERREGGMGKRCAVGVTGRKDEKD